MGREPRDLGCYLFRIPHSALTFCLPFGRVYDIVAIRLSSDTPKAGRGNGAVPPGATPAFLSTLTPQSAPPIPDHEVLRRIGQGSYGDVWMARNILGELRAVKIVHRRSFEDDRPFQREFEGIQKFEPISRSHPSQLAILHVGRNEVDGYFYYVMELADN